MNKIGVRANHNVSEKFCAVIDRVSRKSNFMLMGHIPVCQEKSGNSKAHWINACSLLRPCGP